MQTPNGDLPVWVIVIVALGGGTLIPMIWRFFTENHTKNSDHARTDNQVLIEKLKDDLLKEENRNAMLSAELQQVSSRMDALRKNMAELQVENARNKTELKWVEKELEKETKRSAELRAIVSNLRGLNK